MKRESFNSRIGFILVSAGCAIGLGNVWKFPYMCGTYGGAAFILIYLLFLAILGIPVLLCEFAVGRGSRQSIATSYRVLSPPGTKWKNLGFLGMAGSYILMMFYTMVGGWMMYYCFKSLRGDFVGATPSDISADFDLMLGNIPVMIFWTVLSCIIGFTVCALGLKNGIEKVSKVMMSALLIIMVVLAIHSVTMPGASEGIRFYLLPDFNKMMDTGIGNVVFAALSQAFFTLSIGVGSMQIFGSYLDKKRSLLSEAASITALDTFVALVAGLVVIPACFSFGIQPDAGPRLVFITLPNIFAQMPGGRIWSSLFFLFLTFAALSTIIAVFENLVAFNIDRKGFSRKKSVAVCTVLMIILSMPCVLGFNVLSGIQPLGEGSTIMDLEDFIVSNNLLPLGSLAYVLFCSRKNGWGWDNFIAEVNEGSGKKFPRQLRPYISYCIPLIIIAIYLKGYYDMFSNRSPVTFWCWMIFGVILLGFIMYCALAKGKKAQRKAGDVPASLE